MSQLILLLTLLLITFLFSVHEEQESGNFSKESRSLQSVRLDKKLVLGSVLRFREKMTAEKNEGSKMMTIGKA